MHKLRERLDFLNEIKEELSKAISAMNDEISALKQNEKIFEKLYKNEIQKLETFLSVQNYESSLIYKELNQMIFLGDYL